MFTNICASPVQPWRSRVGQSVGTSAWLFFADHIVFCTNLFIRLCEQSNESVGCISEYTATAVKSSAFHSASPSTSIYWKPNMANFVLYVFTPPLQTYSIFCNGVARFLVAH